MALSTSATESLLRAVDIIATSKIGETSYDQTIICTIVDNSEAEKRGFYTVTDGKVRFKAYTNVTDYKVGDQIRVTIPNGDFNAKKYVDGPHASDNDSEAPITYVSPLDSFLNMADLIDSSENNSGALKANDLDMQKQNGITIWSKKLTDSSYIDFQNNGIYDAIGISADFKCLLGNYNMKSGNYGLRLDIKVKVNKTDSYIMKSFYLDSSEMFGNPYNFIAPSAQEKMFNTVSFGTISEMTLYFYQKNNFVYLDPDDNSLKNIAVGENYNIFVSNIQISFGTNIINVEDNTLRMYTLSNTDFNYINPTDQTNLKKMGLLWYNKNELNQYLGFSDGIVETDGDTIIPYDEIQYLKESKKATRLSSQMGKDDVPKDESGLELAALTDEAFIAVGEAKTLIKEDLVNVLKNYQTRLETLLPEALVIIDESYLNPLQNDEDGFIKSFEEDLDTKQEYLKQMLAHVAKIQRVQNLSDYWEVSEEAERPEDALGIALATLIEEKFNTLQSIHDNVMTKFSNLVSTDEYQGFKGSYDSFATAAGNILTLIKNKINEVIEKAYITDTQTNEETGEITTEKTLLENALLWYCNNTDKYTGIYTPPEEDDHFNRYCIYWYRYVPGYVDPNTEFDFAGPEWKRLIPNITEIQNSSSGELVTIPNNLGLPNTFFEKDGIKYLDKRPSKNEGLLNIYLEPKTHQEKFKAVLFYNHDKYECEPIIFTNVDDITAIYTDKASALSIEHIEDSSDTYQPMYSANNFLVNRANAKKNRAVKAVYNGVLGTTEEVLVDLENPAYIYWYIPKENTMINVDLEYMTKSEEDGGAGFTTDYVPTYRFKPGILERMRKWNEWLKNKYGNSSNYWLKVLQDRPYADTKGEPGKYNFDEFDFTNVFKGFKQVGDFLSLTEDYSMKRLERNTSSQDLINWGGKWLPLKLKLPVLNENNEITEDAANENNLIEEELVEEVKSEYFKEGYAYFYKKIDSLEDTKFYYQIKNFFVKNEANNQILCLVEKNGETFEASLNITFGTQGALGADYNFIIDPADKQSAVQPDKALQVNISLFDYNEKQIPIYEYNLSSECKIGDAYLTDNTQSTNYINWIGNQGAYSFTLKENKENIIIGGEISRSKSSDTIGAILSLTASFKNEDGNNESNVPEGSNGTDYKKKKLSNITTFYSVPYSPQDFYIEGATSVIYNNEGGNPDYYKNPYKIFDISDNMELGNVSWRIRYYSCNNNTFKEITDSSTIKFCENYLPVLNDKNILTPCSTYLDEEEAETKYYAFIQCLNSSNQVIWSQPIIVRKNRYAANMNNAFDSSMSINLDTGCIISSLMNAFRRGGTTGNSLQGFLVGDLQKMNGSELQKYLGLYGFNSGQQSFAFDVNGSAVIGKSGGAQIKFDEALRQYQILSSSFSDGAQGLKIDLEDGIIDIYGTKKDGDERKQVTTTTNKNNSFFPNLSTQFKYTNLNSGSEKKSSHIYINAASSSSNQGYEKPQANSLPNWWQIWTGREISTTDSSYGGSSSGSNNNNTLDTSNALFKIEVPSDSETSQNGYQSLLLISDENCLIQSNNYQMGQYAWNSEGGSINKNGDGMRIDLSYGAIDAYKLKISSNNILINSSGDSDPLFVVRIINGDQCKNLMYVEENENNQAFYLQSSDYQTKTESENGKGLKFDIRNGTIESYNFSLRGETAADDNNQYAGSYIHITSNNEKGEPALRFHLKNSEAISEEIKTNGIDLLHITPTVFVLHSTDYDPTAGTGLELDIGHGRIESYNFSLKGQATDSIYGGSYIWITSDTEPDDEENGMPKIEFKLIKNSNDSNIDISLLSISPEEFFLLSPNFDTGNGIKLDILSGSIEVRNKNVDLMSIGSEVFQLTSPNWEENSSGMQIDLMSGKIRAFKTSDQSEKQSLIIDGNAKTFPLQIGIPLSDGSGDLAFRVDWDGVIYLNDSQFVINNSQGETDDEGNAVTGGTFTWSNIRVKKTDDGKNGNIVAEGYIRAYGGLYGNSIYVRTGSKDPIKLFDIEGRFVNTFNIYDGSNITASIDKKGALQATSANISGALYADSLNINNNSITLANNGRITAKALEIKDSSTYFVVNSDGSATFNKEVTFNDTVTFTGGFGDMNANSLNINNSSIILSSVGKITTKTLEVKGNSTYFVVNSNGEATFNKKVTFNTGASVEFKGNTTFSGTTSFNSLEANSLNIGSVTTLDNNGITLNNKGLKIKNSNNKVVAQISSEGAITVTGNNITKTFTPKQFVTADIQIDEKSYTVLLYDNSYSYILGA